MKTVDEAEEADRALRVFDEASVRRYVRSGGTRCLFCGDSSIEGSSFDSEEGGASQELTCARCGGTWTDVHRLVGVMVEGEFFMKRDRKGRPTGPS